MFQPIIAGYWTHADLIDGRYTIDDLFDILEIMAVKAENEQRAQEAAERKV